MKVPEILQKALHMSPSYDCPDIDEYLPKDSRRYCPVNQDLIKPCNLGFNGRPQNAITQLMHARVVGDFATEQAIEKKLRLVTGERSVPSDADVRQVMNDFIPGYCQTPYEYQKLAEKFSFDKMRKDYSDRLKKAQVAYRKRLNSLFEDPKNSEDLKNSKSE